VSIETKGPPVALAPLRTGFEPVLSSQMSGISNCSLYSLFLLRFLSSVLSLVPGLTDAGNLEIIRAGNRKWNAGVFANKSLAGSWASIFLEAVKEIV